jgi:hypothetical protein
MSNIGRTILHQIKNIPSLILSQKSNKIYYIYIIILIVFLSLILSAIYNKFNRNENNCSNILNIINGNKIRSIDDSFEHTLKDYYIKTAYNCCCSGEFRRDYVNICALENSIKQGARCLDFEIYSLNDKPVVAASSSNNYKIKETYNSLSIDQVFNIINSIALTKNKGCKNYEDPLFLNFRIMSNNCKMYNNLADIINAKFNDKIYPGICSQPDSLVDIPIKTLKNQVIIMIDKPIMLMQETNLTNLCSITTSHYDGNSSIKLLRNSDMLTKQSLANDNKKRMSIVLPDTSIGNANIDFVKAHNYGCQFVGLSFQKNDAKLEAYNNMFDVSYSAFILKPENLRDLPHDRLGTHPRIEGDITETQSNVERRALKGHSHQDITQNVERRALKENVKKQFSDYKDRHEGPDGGHPHGEHYLPSTIEGFEIDVEKANNEFNSIDTNNDLIISRKELEKFNPKLTKKIIDDIFKIFDTENPGEITLGEFYDIVIKKTKRERANSGALNIRKKLEKDEGEKIKQIIVAATNINVANSITEPIPLSNFDLKMLPKMIPYDFNNTQTIDKNEFWLYNYDIALKNIKGLFK